MTLDKGLFSFILLLSLGAEASVIVPRLSRNKAKSNLSVAATSWSEINTASLATSYGVLGDYYSSFLLNPRVKYAKNNFGLQASVGLLNVESGSLESDKEADYNIYSSYRIDSKVAVGIELRERGVSVYRESYESKGLSLSYKSDNNVFLAVGANKSTLSDSYYFGAGKLDQANNTSYELSYRRSISKFNQKVSTLRYEGTKLWKSSEVSSFIEMDLYDKRSFFEVGIDMEFLVSQFVYINPEARFKMNGNERDSYSLNVGRREEKSQIEVSYSTQSNSSLKVFGLEYSVNF